MDGENNGKPYFLMDDLEGKPHYFWKPPFLLLNENSKPWNPAPNCKFSTPMEDEKTVGSPTATAITHWKERKNGSEPKLQGIMEPSR